MLLITTPAQHLADNPSVELNPRRLKALLESAPIMDVQKTVTFLEARITSFNEISVTSTERLKLLEIFHSRYDEILVSYDDLRLSTLPISLRERKAISLDIMWLYLHLATGYKILIKQYSAQEAGSLSDKSIVLAIYRAMELIIAALLHTFRAHEEVPPLAYLEMHQLYSYAVRLDVATSRIRQLNSIHGHPCIADLYKQFLLLVIVDPYRQVSNTIFQIFLLFEEHAHHAELNPDPDTKNNISDCYQVSAFEDLPPLRTEITSPRDAGQIYLDISPVIQSLKKSATNITPDNFTRSSEIRLLEVILSRLEHSGKRSEERTSCNQPIKVWFGMAASRYFLQSADNLKNVLQIERHQGIEVSSLDSEEAGAYTLSDFVMENHSEGGFYLRGKQGENMDLSGDIAGLLGIDRPVDVNQPSTLLPELALIRWERGAGQKELQLGVERIKGIPHSMQLNCASSNETFPGLFFTPSDQPSRINFLLIPTPVYTEKRKLNMIIKQKSITVTLGARVFHSSKYTVCRLTSE